MTPVLSRSTNVSAVRVWGNGEQHSGDAEHLPNAEEQHSGDAEHLPDAEKKQHSGDAEHLPNAEEQQSGDVEHLPNAEEQHSSVSTGKLNVEKKQHSAGKRQSKKASISPATKIIQKKITGNGTLYEVEVESGQEKEWRSADLIDKKLVGEFDRQQRTSRKARRQVGENQDDPNPISNLRENEQQGIQDGEKELSSRKSSKSVAEDVDEAEEGVM
eukprot:TRINITY_DN1470_c0_g1_i9.p1 TRINITY_DN1470_c0_g1~~TRINITY_DN1470_c0_g1_i9.p1  ORF type:complete len:215 (-),score=51.09 TRINITY_DN1470_c0_g1_i9:94-738(-)